jgi:hypothetical protein
MDSLLQTKRMINRLHNSDAVMILGANNWNADKGFRTLLLKSVNQLGECFNKNVSRGLY